MSLLFGWAVMGSMSAEFICPLVSDGILQKEWVYQKPTDLSNKSLTLIISWCDFTVVTKSEGICNTEAPNQRVTLLFMLLKKKHRVPEAMNMPFITHFTGKWVEEGAALGRELQWSVKMLQGCDKRRVLEKAGTPDTNCFLCSLWLLVRQPPVLWGKGVMSWATLHTTPALLLHVTVFTLVLLDREPLGGESIGTLQPYANTLKGEEVRAEKAKEDMDTTYFPKNSTRKWMGFKTKSQALCCLITQCV